MKREKQIKRSHFLVLNMWWYVYSWFLFYYLNCKLFIYWLNVNNLYARKPINPQQHITTILSLMELEMVTRTFTFIVVRKHFIWFFLLLSRAQYIEAKIHIHTIYIYKFPFAILYIAFNAGSFNKCGSLSVFFFYCCHQFEFNCLLLFMPLHLDLHFYFHCSLTHSYTHMNVSMGFI